MIAPDCSKCGDELREFGGLIHSPPKDPLATPHEVDKYHICLSCWEQIKAWLDNRAIGT
jgi:hypothetical protein